MQKCENLGVEFGVRKFEKTVMFDNEDGLMQTTDGRIRLRKNEWVVEGKKLKTALISYKKPLKSKDGEAKREIEIETGVEDFNKMKEILEKMGFKEVSSYEKYRTKAKNLDIDLTIDEYPFTSFVEIEGEENKIKESALKLGFNLEKHINLPADTLFNIWRKNMGLPEKMIMDFKNFNN